MEASSLALGFHRQIPSKRRFTTDRSRIARRKTAYICRGGAGGLEVPSFKLERNYKGKIARYYDKASEKYDVGPWHHEIAKKLIDGCELKGGEKVLDLCTGTGISALLAADGVGENGRVVGVDISPLMLEKLEEKLTHDKRGGRVEAILGDAETIDFPPQSFDWILCSSAFIWMTDLVTVLARWREFLVPGGGLAFHAFPEEAFVTGVELIDAAAKNGVELTFSQPTGTESLVEDLLTHSGYSGVEIHRESAGNWMAVEKAEAAFEGMMDVQGPMMGPIEDLPKDIIDSIRTDYIEGIRSRATEDGVWNDMSILYTYAKKN
ncbi:hypothetical protein BSKO_03798 [Bryopsis sp. KO-2023]|nr:hypothetical protein BSKO_03798 [Bryopsis sp. KO-2023]